MNLPDFLTPHPWGSIRLTGHRIGLEHVMNYYHRGYSPEMLVEQYPTLSLELVNRVLAFYRQNQAEVDAYVARCQAEVDRQRAAATRSTDWAELQRKFEAKSTMGI